MTNSTSSLITTFAALDGTHLASPRTSSSSRATTYAASDCQSLLSTKSTSKSFIAQIFERKSSKSSSARQSSEPMDPNEAKHAARATYFSTM